MSEDAVFYGDCQHCRAKTELWVQGKFCSLPCANCEGATYSPDFGTCSDLCKRRHIRDRNGVILYRQAGSFLKAASELTAREQKWIQLFGLHSFGTTTLAVTTPGNTWEDCYGAHYQHRGADYTVKLTATDLPSAKKEALSWALGLLQAAGEELARELTRLEGDT